MKKVALITGITGQTGSYLAELLLEKGYVVHGTKRRSSSFNTQRVDSLFSKYPSNFHLHFADMTDGMALRNLISTIKPLEVYNLAAQSHVAVSFEQPEYTANADALGTLRLLEAVRHTGIEGECRFYQASTSELFGGDKITAYSELSNFAPKSPYAAAKAYAHYLTRIYREAYNMFAVCGILFNHESPRRGETFVTRKITRGLSRIKKGYPECLLLGNIYSERDWGHAQDYAVAQWLMLQQETPRDLVISTGERRSVKEFLCLCAEFLGMELAWEGSGLEERAYWVNDGKSRSSRRPIVCVDKKYFRPNEVDFLLGDSTVAREILNWKPTRSFLDLVQEMCTFDLEQTPTPTP